MKSRTLWAALTFHGLLMLAIAGCGSGGGTPSKPPAAVAAPNSAAPATQPYVVTGPNQHTNLTLFLIHGPDATPGKTYLTLQEALDQKKVIIHETGDVNELSIQNVSNQDVFIQSGDIIKGGRQDRTIPNDWICSANSGVTPLSVFCVENGRWEQRGNEDSSTFADSNAALPTKQLKLAAKSEQNQGAVWASVGGAQATLSGNAGGAVNDAISPSSLQLSLENGKVQQAVDAYCKDLKGIVDTQPDVIGYATAINGKLNSIDVYGSHALFMKMWDKNLRASATEAFADFQKDAKWTPVQPQAVDACLSDALAGKILADQKIQRVRLVTQQTQANQTFQTYDKDDTTPAPIHLNVLTRDPQTNPATQPSGGDDRQLLPTDDNQ